MDIYYDSLTEADWFSGLNSAFSFEVNKYRQIKGRGDNTAVIDQLVLYDRPDIIVV